MRITLPESSQRRQRSAGSTIASAIIHATVIGGTLVATGMSAERPRYPKVQPENIVFVKSHDIDQPALKRPRVSTAERPPVIPREILAPLPSTVSVVVDPSIVPTGVPPVDAALGVPFDSTARASDGAGSGAASSSGSGDSGTPMTAFTVDREVVPLRGVAPRYPSLLASANIEGMVVMQFVVDTLGRVERGSLDVVRADHALFEQSVREALARMRFVPAEAGGRKVRQLVEQPFTFALTRRD
ncbi:MAG: TonB family protein [Gemmatimonadaceae bacterium]